MEMNPGALPHPGRVSAQEFCPPETCFRWRQRSELLLEKRGLESGFPPGGKNRGQRGHRGDPPVSQEGRWRDLGLGRARHPPGCLVVALLSCLVYSGSFRSADFYIIFPRFIGHFNYWKNLKYKNNRKQELATGCTELID